MNNIDIINKFRILLVTYPDPKDVNLSIMKDKLNDRDVQNELKERNIIVEYVKKGDDFHIELVDQDGEIRHTVDKFNDDTFDIIFKIADQMTPKAAKVDDVDRAGEVVVTESVTTEETPTDQDMDDMADEVEEVERLEGDQERDTDPVGDTYQSDTTKDFSYNKKITKKDYLRMKRKYLKLKESIYDGF